MRFGNCNCNGHRANKEYYTYNFSHNQETGTNIVFGVDADEDIELMALLEHDDLMPVRKSFIQVRSFKAIMISNICNVQSECSSTRQAQEPTDNLSAQSMDQECFEEDTLCRIRLRNASLYYHGEICHWTALIISSLTFENA